MKILGLNLCPKFENLFEMGKNFDKIYQSIHSKKRETKIASYLLI